MIALEHLAVSYGQQPILDNINAELADSCITAVMGPNGCGKTTLLRCIGGALTPTSGRVLLDGRAVGDYRPRELARRCAFVRQHSQTDFEFTAEQAVMMGRNPYQHPLQNESEEDMAIVEEALRQTGTLHLRHKRPSEMSGGELQRVMIARALAQQTPLLLLDEPVSSLDIAHQIDIMRLLRSMTGKTILIVIHDLGLALRFCDRLLLLHNRHAVFHGPIAQGLSPANIRTVYGVNAEIRDGRVLFEY